MKETSDLAKKLLVEAPRYKTIGALSIGIGSSRATVYRLFMEDPELKTEIDAVLGTNLLDLTKKVVKTVSNRNKKARETKKKKPSKKKKDVSVTRKTAEPVTVTINPRESRGAPTDVRTRTMLATQICALISKGSTVGQACEIVGVGHTTFYEWCNPNATNYVDEIRVMKIQAMQSFNLMHDEEITMIAKTSLRQIVSGQEVTQVTKIGRVDKKGDVKAHTVRQDTKKVAPNFAATRFILERVESKKFGTPEERRLANAGEELGIEYTHRSKTLEELQQEEQDLMRRLGLI